VSPIHYAVVGPVVRLLFKKSQMRVLWDIASGGINKPVMPFTNPETHAMGGRASAAKLTPAERRAKALKAVQIREAKRKQLKKAA
jgi:hypothetical protein